MNQLHPLQRRVLRFIHQEQLLVSPAAVLVAVSGGPDSVALLHLLASLRERCGIRQLTVLHFNHQLRGTASAEDQAFVASLAAALGLPLETATADVRAHHRQHHVSLEMAARACRHRFFQDALVRLAADAIALGHTANDQAEEVLLRLVRGTGPAGMAGMLPQTVDHLIRPLLEITRQDLLAYLQDHRLRFREDLSNLDPNHQRNAIRHEVLPLLEKYFHPRLSEVLCRHSRLAQGEESLWAEQAADLWRTLCAGETSSRLALDGQLLRAQHPALQRRLLRLAIERLQGNLQGIYCRHLEALRRLLERPSPGRSLELPHGLRATLEGPLLILSTEPRQVPPTTAQTYMPSMPAPGTYEFPALGFSLTIEHRPPTSAPPSSSDADLSSIRLDAELLKWPLGLRTWEPGDRFRPLGLGGTKKLQDFFVDLKIPRQERCRVPLLCDQEKICWVVGYRLDDRVKVTSRTTHPLVIRQTILGEG